MMSQLALISRRKPACETASLVLSSWRFMHSCSQLGTTATTASSGTCGSPGTRTSDHHPTASASAGLLTSKHQLVPCGSTASLALPNEHSCQFLSELHGPASAFTLPAHSRLYSSLQAESRYCKSKTSPLLSHPAPRTHLTQRLGSETCVMPFLPLGVQLRQYARKVSKLEEREAARQEALARKAKKKASRKKVFKKPPPGVDVSPDSPLMMHYKRKLMGAQLVHRLSRRTKVSELRDALLLYEKRTLGDSIAIAAMLTQLSRAKKYDPKYQESSEAVTMILEKLMRGIQERLPETNLRIISTWLWASANLGLTKGENPSMSADMVGSLLERATVSDRKLRMCQPKKMSLLTWSTSKLLTREQFQATPGATAAISRISRHAFTCLHQFSPQGLANLASALATLGALDRNLALAISKESSQRIGDLAVQQFSPRDYIGILGSLAEQEDATEHRPLFAQVAGHLSLPGALDQFWPRELAHMWRVYGQASMTHDGLMEALASAVLSKVGDFDLQSLELVRDAFQTLEVDHPQLAEALGGGAAA